MELREYYRAIRAMEESIQQPWVITVSFTTGDGGRAGVMTEVSRATAAKMIVESRARLASDDEASEYRESIRESRQRIEQEEAKKRVQVTLISEGDLRRLRESAEK
ncbi:MAG: hypothetical protein FJW39_03765 [Acidobacteria bacterium]|nr:hypothetical protein [Acidobacteriota bacterium]